MAFVSFCVSINYMTFVSFCVSIQLNMYDICILAQKPHDKQKYMYPNNKIIDCRLGHAPPPASLVT